MHKKLPVFLSFLLLGFYIFMATQDPSSVWADFTVREPWGYKNAFLGFYFLNTLPVLLAYGLVALLGYVLTRAFFVSIKTTEALKLTASFAPAYLACVGVLRILTLFVPHNQIFLTGVLVISLLILLILKKEPWTLQTKKINQRKELASILTFLGVLAICLVSAVYMGDHFWTGHGEAKYAFYLNVLRGGPGFEKFPLLDQHYDEILFNYFLFMFRSLQINPVILFWFTNAFVKMSASAFLYLLFIKLNVKRPFSAVAAAFLMFGTTSLNPLHYYLLFDSFNPIYFALHPGRIVGILSLFLMLVCILNKSRGAYPYPISTSVFFVLLGLGFSSTPSHNLMYLVFYLLLAVFAKVTPGLWRENKNFWIGIVCCVLPPFFVYNHADEPAGLFLLISIAAACAFVFYWTRELWKEKKELQKMVSSRTMKPLLLFMAAAVFSALFLGNIFSNRLVFLADNIQYINPFGEQVVKVPFEIFKRAEAGGLGIYKPFSEYDKGGMFFLSYYGLVYICALVSIFLIIRKMNDARLRQFKRFEAMPWLVLAVASPAVMPFAFFYMDFMRDITFCWLKSRMLEFPVYMILFIFFFSAGRYASKNFQRAVIVIAMIHILLPLIGMGRLHQWQLNLQFLLHYFG